MDMLKPVRRPMVNFTLTAASIAINCLMLALPVCVMLVYDRVITHQATDTLLVLVAGLAVAVCCEMLLRMLRSRLLNTSALVAEHHQTMRAVDRILHADPLSTQRFGVGDYLERLRSIERIRDYHAGDAEHLHIDVAFALINLALIWAVAGVLVAVPLVVMIFIGIAIALLSGRLRRLLLERISLENDRHDFLSASMAGAHLIRSLAVEALPTRFYERLQSRLDANLRDGADAQGLVQSLGILGSQLVLVLFVTFGAMQVLGGDLTLGALAAGTMLSGRVLQPLLAGVSTWLTLQRIRLAVDSLQELLEMAHGSAETAPGSTNTARGARITINEMAFAYAANEPHVFEHVHLDIEPLQCLGLVGKNGSGKSTLMQLLLGLYIPTQGEILIDGKPAETCVHGEVALLPQTGSLFKGTVGQNLSFFEGGARLREALRIADRLGLLDTLKSLPQGLDTPILGGDSAPLPNAVKQQILIARSLVGDPRLLLVDETASSLDPQGVRAFQEVINDLKGRTTLVLVSNKSSVLGGCDRVVAIDTRRLVDVTHKYKPQVSS